MTDIDTLTEHLWMIAVPGRRPFAEKLIADGLKHFPWKATKKVVREPGTERLGNWAPRHTEPLRSPQQEAGLALLQPPAPKTAVPGEVKAAEETAAIAALLTFMPIPSRPPLAALLRDLGWRAPMTPPAKAAKAQQAGPPQPPAMDQPTMLNALRKIGQRVPALAGLADQVQAAADAAERGDTTARDQLGAELLEKFTAERDLLESRRGEVTAENLEPEADS